MKITTLIDLDLKTTFDLLAMTHKKNYRDAIELGVLSIIAEVDPAKALEMQLEKQEQELMKTRQALAQVKLLNEKKALEEKHQVKAKEERDSGIDKIRLDKFEKSKESLAWQVKGGSTDWKLIADLYMFKTSAEARAWVLSKLRGADLLG